MVGVKQYTGTILLGKTTPSYDLETEFDQEFSTEHIGKIEIEQARLKFLGKIAQVPPIFSAKQVDGKRAYDLARAGKTIELKSNMVEIIDFQLDNSRFPEIDFSITCSKGTYIRSIAHDLGKMLGSGGTLVALRRTASGDFNLQNARSVEEWIEIIRREEE
jgi:tRNA pseudouridine55 synthase